MWWQGGRVGRSGSFEGSVGGGGVRVRWFGGTFGRGWREVNRSIVRSRSFGSGV